jgi:hypothetical protein
MILVCPICGWEQKLDHVDVWMWFFSKQPGGHPMTCGSGKCPSHTELVVKQDDIP